MKPLRATVSELTVTLVDTSPPPGAREPPARRGWLRRRRNRRVAVVRFSVMAWLANVLSYAAGKLVVAGKVLVALLFLAGAAWGGQRAVRHVMASPRFALREIRVAPTEHVDRDDLVALAGVSEGDKLLAIDTDAVATRVAAHPWVASARVRRELPSSLAIDVVERRAAAVGLLGALYLLDGNGRPFKRAALDEAEGLPVLTGVTREQYGAQRAATEAAFREALALLAAYHGDPAAAAAPAHRPALSEVHIDPRSGFSLVLLDGGGELRMGRGDWPAKLGRLDRVLASVRPRGTAALRAVFLDGDSGDRVTIRLAPPPAPPAAAPPGKKFRPAEKRGED